MDVYSEGCGAGLAALAVKSQFKSQDKTEVTLEFIVTTERIRNLLSKSSISQATTGQAEAFMLLYAEQLDNTLQAALKGFVTGKMK